MIELRGEIQIYLYIIKMFLYVATDTFVILLLFFASIFNRTYKIVIYRTSSFSLKHAEGSGCGHSSGCYLSIRSSINISETLSVSCDTCSSFISVTTELWVHENVFFFLLYFYCCLFFLLSVWSRLQGDGPSAACLGCSESALTINLINRKSLLQIQMMSVCWTQTSYFWFFSKTFKRSCPLALNSILNITLFVLVDRIFGVNQSLS